MTAINWQRVVLNIKAAGVSYQAAGRRVRMAPETIGHLARGEVNEPRFSQGVALLNLHHALCPDKHSVEALRV